MMIALLVICMVLSLVASIWALVIIFKRSIIGGLLSLFLGLPMLYYLVTGWGKEGEDIKVPFFLSLMLYSIAIAIGVSVAGSAAKDVQDQLKQMSAPPARSSPAFRETTPATESVRISNPPAPRPVAPAPQAAGVQRVDPNKLGPSRQKPLSNGCVYKPVMTDEDMAKCR